MNEKVFISDWSSYIKKLAAAIEEGTIESSDAVWCGPEHGDAVISDTLDMHKAYNNYTYEGQVSDYL